LKITPDIYFQELKLEIVPAHNKDRSPALEILDALPLNTYRKQHKESEGILGSISALKNPHDYI
jgi:hypothetical protein